MFYLVLVSNVMALIHEKPLKTFEYQQVRCLKKCDEIPNFSDEIFA